MVTLLTMLLNSRILIKLCRHSWYCHGVAPSLLSRSREGKGWMLKCAGRLLWRDQSWWGSISEDIMRAGGESPTDTQQSMLVSIIHDKANSRDRTLTQVITPERKVKSWERKTEEGQRSWGLEVHIPVHSKAFILLQSLPAVSVSGLLPPAKSTNWKKKDEQHGSKMFSFEAMTIYYTDVNT